ncbi:hypothetical protein [Sulfurihydrogenibium sp. YO3AOP1]|uniref:hypothetical protein n=1 Tax=Sulfurihydrogenibium sp. (strain YO3AOP1) TaxID=436114 RepID=UPI002482D2AC|nr:hypothetical protein [Sulfurihydrogenibium sp. YO3AOP1]
MRLNLNCYNIRNFKIGRVKMYSKELIERVEELAKVYSKVIVSLDSKERKIEMFESYYKILRTLQDIQSSETLEKSFYD